MFEGRKALLLTTSFGVAYGIGSLPAFASGPVSENGQNYLGPGQSLDLALNFDGENNRATVSVCTGSQRELNRLDGRIFTPRQKAALDNGEVVEPIGRLTQSNKDFDREVWCRTWTGGREGEGQWSLWVKNIGNEAVGFSLLVRGLNFEPGASLDEGAVPSPAQVSLCPPPCVVVNNRRICRLRPCKIF